MTAIIQSLRNGITPIAGASRDDLRLTDVMTLQSVNAATTYAWTIAYKPDGSAAAFSGSAVAQSPGTITVDLVGPYLIRLTVDAGLATENTQVVRLRALTILGDLKLVAAGEQNAGSLPVPVDISTTGWADEQNFNIQTMLAFIKQVAISGRVVTADPNLSTEGYGDYSTVQAAIDYAVAQGAAAATPWVVMVNGGLYVENLTLKPHVHLMGRTGAGSMGACPIIRTTGGATTHTAPLTNAADVVLLYNLRFENTSSTPTAAMLYKTGAGTLVGVTSTFLQNGVAAAIGPAIQSDAGIAAFSECNINTSTGNAAGRFAFSGVGGIVQLTRCSLEGPSGLSLGAVTATNVQDTEIESTTGSTLTSDAPILNISYSTLTTATGTVLDIHPGAGALVGTVTVSVRWSRIGGAITFDKTGITGNTTLNVGSSEYTTITLPGGALTSQVATTNSDSLFFDNTLSGMTAEDVQSALDELHTLAVLVTTLDEAYDGGVGGGAGRTIVADSGAVQITDAAVPSDPPDVANTNGRLQVSSSVEIGAVSKPEIDLNPNPYGNGPMLVAGQEVWADNAPWGSTGFFFAGINPGLAHNYNFRAGTQSARGAGSIGKVFIRAGDSFDASGVGADAPPIYIQAGTANDAASGAAGDLYLAPGDSALSGGGRIYIARPESGTGATLTAAGAFVGGVAGTIRFATDMGAIEVAILAGDNLATVLGKFNATYHVTAVDSGGGVIQLTTVSMGPTAEIFYLNETTVGLDIALGTFDGQSQVDGAWATMVNLYVKSSGELAVSAPIQASNGFDQEKILAATFVFGGGVSAVTLGSTPDAAPGMQGAVIVFVNGAADMDNVGAAVPALATEYRINGNDLEIGTDITATGNTYRIVYPTV